VVVGLAGGLQADREEGVGVAVVPVGAEVGEGCGNLGPKHEGIGHAAYARAESAPAPGVGFRWKVNGSSIVSLFHVVQPFESLVWSGRTLGARAIHAWRIEVRDGGCRVEVAESMEGWLIRLFRKAMNESLARDMRFWLERLKEEAEAQKA
jgi:hypothetical protein